MLTRFLLGSTARIGPQTLLSSDIDYIRRINARKSPYSRSDWYKGGRFVPNEDTLLSETDDAKHRALRSKMAPAVTTFLLASRLALVACSTTDF